MKQSMKIIYTHLILPKKFEAINLLGIIFVRKDVVLTQTILNHEQIHTAQIKELGYLFFYLFYLSEWFIKLFKYGSKSYYNISFEREAYANDKNPDYLKNRKKRAFTSYF